MTVYIKNTNGTKESFYLTRLKDSLIANHYDEEKTLFTYWTNHRRFDEVIESSNHRCTFHEEEYLGHQLIVVGFHQSWRTPLDAQGNKFSRARNIDADEVEKLIASYSTDESDSGNHTAYTAYAWKIGGNSDSIANLSYTTQYAVLKGICSSQKIEVTLKNAKKKLDLLHLLESVKDELSSVCTEKVFYKNNLEVPYNAVVGDLVWIPAFGRWRMGKIVKTTGSRFVVGYVTPANTDDIKYKTLALSGLRIKP